MQFSATHGRGGGGVRHPIFERSRHSFICQAAGEISVEKESSIQAFSAKYGVDQDLLVKYHASPCIP